MKLFLSLYLALATTILADVGSNTLLKVTTYNLGLAHTFVPYAKERLAPLISELSNYDSDILCLQEVWTKKDQKKIHKALNKNFPFSFKTKIKNFRQGPRPTCRIKEIFGEGKFVSCMQKQCGDKDGDDFTDCIIEKCDSALQNLKAENRNCASALMAQVGKSPIASILTLLNPLWRAGLFAYKGSNGLMLYSKYPLEDKRYVDFKDVSTLNRRGALQAVVNVDGKKVQVMCTHITADLSVPYTGLFEDWKEENGEQMERLLQTANQKIYPTVLMGDFNCGFEDPLAGILGELSENCQKALDWNYSDPLSEETRECTFCSSNILNGGNENSVAIDHVFLKGLNYSSSKVVFKKKISIEDKEKGRVQTQLSDHYGLEVEVQLP